MLSLLVAEKIVRLSLSLSLSLCVSLSHAVCRLAQATKCRRNFHRADKKIASCARKAAVMMVEGREGPTDWMDGWSGSI